MEWVIAAVVAVAITLFLVWLRWIIRRRIYWFERLTTAIPTNSDWWKAQRSKPGEILYVAIGDSTAQGIGASRPGRSYVGVVAAYIRASTSKKVRVVNLGISGATVGIAIAKQLPALEKLDADIVTVSIGANDMPSFDPVRFQSQIEQLFDALPAHAIVADLPTFYILPSERRVKVANAILRAAAASRGLTVVDLHHAMSRQGAWGVITQFAGDLFHPNDRGYRVWASPFLAAVDERLRSL
jgi:acyl-CoA thioesterase I